MLSLQPYYGAMGFKANINISFSTISGYIHSIQR